MFAARKTDSAVAVAATYVEDVFSTWLYTGTGATQTITNNIDLSGKGGLTWLKGRSGATANALYDTVRGATFDLVSSSTAAQTTESTGLTAFNSNGFSIGALAKLNTNAATYTSWTFREQPKFFDVVTYTGNGANRTISHNLGSVPGCIIVKRTDTTGAWAVYHRSLANTEYMVLNTTAAKATGATYWNSTTPTSTEFSLGTATDVNANTGTYVAYLFAHDAGGFGAAGTDNVISCGSFTTTSGGDATITLGYEPQWLIFKSSSDGTNNWTVRDNLRGFNAATNGASVLPNSTAAETSPAGIGAKATPTGFTINTGGASTTYIYITVRRGPMKTPTSGTSVLGLNARAGTGANDTVTGGAGVTDLAIIKNRTGLFAALWVHRLTATNYMLSNGTAAETAAANTFLQTNPWDVMDGIKVGTTSTTTNDAASTYINYLFDRAPGFFDIACYTGTGANTTISHNLGVAPELMIVKRRDATGNWYAYHTNLTSASYVISLNSTAVESSITTVWNSTAPTSTVFSVGTSTNVNASAGTYVAYLFASLTGVSKVGGYTGTGTTLQINCGFTAGARFVLIKRIDSTGDWYYWDTARGIVSGNDPYLLMNSTAVEVTNTDYLDPYSAGFEISSTAPAEINANGGNFIYLAIA